MREHTGTNPTQWDRQVAAKQRWPREGCRTNQGGWAGPERGYVEEEHGPLGPAGQQPQPPRVLGGRLCSQGHGLPVCIIVFVHIVLCMIPVRLRSRGGAPCHLPIYIKINIYICM